MKWRKVSQDVKTRNGDQCWKRWNDCLKPEINHSPWSMQEVSHMSSFKGDSFSVIQILL